MKKKIKGLTLIELLVGIGIILILALIIIITIRPGERMAMARDAAREQHLVHLQSVIYAYYIDNNNYPADNIPRFYSIHTMMEICDTNREDADCSNLVDLSSLVNDGYLTYIPVDPLGGDTEHGTGYYIAERSIILRARGERRPGGYIIIGSSEDADQTDPSARPSCSPIASCGEDLICGHNTYPTVQIGTQCWLAKDFTFKDHCIGNEWVEDDITEGAGGHPLSINSTGPQNACREAASGSTNYGNILYQFEAAMLGGGSGGQGICPLGWHIPTDAEWKMLEGTVDSYFPVGDPVWNLNEVWRGGDVGFRLKADYISSWCNDAECGSSGFDALPGGGRHGDGSLMELGVLGAWHTSTVSPDKGISAYAYGRAVEAGFGDIYRGDHRKDGGSSLRCIKN